MAARNAKFLAEFCMKQGLPLLPPRCDDGCGLKVY